MKGEDNSTYSKINVLHGLFDECNIPYSELSFEFRPDEGENNEEDELILEISEKICTFADR